MLLGFLFLDGTAVEKEKSLHIDGSVLSFVKSCLDLCAEALLKAALDSALLRVLWWRRCGK